VRYYAAVLAGTTPQLSAPTTPPRLLTSVALVYRYVVGYSAIEGSPGPSFALELLGLEPLKTAVPGADVGADAGADADADGRTPRELYRSDQFAPQPFSWDVETGGSPTNYSAPIRVHRKLEPPLALGAGSGQLRLRFRNGKRNMHLQGEAAAGCDLQLRLGFGGAELHAPTEPPPPLGGAGARGGACDAGGSVADATGQADQAEDEELARAIALSLE
jgi:hypothetical protein